MSEPIPDPLYELYALGQLEEPERAAIAGPLAAGDAAARRRLAEALELNALVSTMVPDIEPPPRLRRRILAAAGIEEKTGWSWFGAWGLATAALLGGMVYYSVEATRLRRDVFDSREELASTQTRLERSESSLRFLRLPDTRLLPSSAGEARQPLARVFVNPSQGVLLMAANLPALPAGRVFEMWLVPKAGAPIPAGTFRAEPGGQATHVSTQAFDAAATAAVALSVEPAGGSPAPTTTPFLVTGL